MNNVLQGFCAAILLATGARLAAQDKALTGLASMHVPEGFNIEVAAGPDLSPYGMCAAFDDRGRLFICESSGKNLSGRAMGEAPECKIRMLEDTNHDGLYDKSTVYADKIGLPMGLQWYRGSLFVGSAPDLLKFTDTDNDGIADKREVILTGWNLHNTASLHGPFLGPDGWLYLTHGRHGYKITTKEGETLEGKAARIWRCKPDGSQLERFCGGGFDNPVELIFTPAGEMIGTMTYFTDPHNGQRDALMHWMEGGVHQKNYSEVMGEFTFTGELLPPMTKFARIAPAGLMQYRGTSFGPDYKDNLFSAQFNPHRVQRHKLFREGATFRTEDEDFLTSTDPDFHPCDVLEDADGSLLVVDTGGWYVDACPLSRISRPEIRGAILRIRKKDAPKISDPRGLELDLAHKSAKDRVESLTDARPAVRDRVTDLLAQAGDDSVPALADFLVKKSGAVEARCAAVSILSQINTVKSRETVHFAFKDPEQDVRIAACRAVGINRDSVAVSELMRLIQSDTVAVRREAATSLGRIGDVQAVGAILNATAAITDRFMEHAMIYALIQLKDISSVVEALKRSSPSTRRCALIALDQMPGHPLQKEQLINALKEKAEPVRQAALWVAAHHPDWSVEIVEFLRAGVLSKDFSATEASSLQPIISSFIQQPEIQDFLAELLSTKTIDSSRRAFLLSAIEKSPLKTFSPKLASALGSLLHSADVPVRAQVIALLRSRGAAGLDGDLKKIADDAAQPASLRVAALGAFSAHRPRLTTNELEFLSSHLTEKTEASLRLSAAQVIAKAAPTDEQLLPLAREQLSRVDALVFPVLLNAFARSTNAAVGQALVAAILKTSVNLNQLAGKMEELLKNYPPEVHAAGQPLYDRIQAQQESRKGRLAELEPLLTGGDVGRGRRVFYGQKAACFGCHSIGKEGGVLGPDLTSVGAIRSGRDIIEAIVFPSASFVPGYEPYRIETEDETYAGVIGEQSADAIVLRTGANATVQLLRQNIKSMTPGTVSVMPEGLDAALTKSELTDLLAFLQAQNGNPFLQPGKK